MDLGLGYNDSSVKAKRQRRKKFIIAIIAIAIAVGVYVWWRTGDEDMAVEAGTTVIPDQSPIPIGVADPAVAGGIINTVGYAEAVKELSKDDPDEINWGHIEQIHQRCKKWHITCNEEVWLT